MPDQNPDRIWRGHWSEACAILLVMVFFAVVASGAEQGRPGLVPVPEAQGWASASR